MAVVHKLAGGTAMIEWSIRIDEDGDLALVANGHDILFVDKDGIIQRYYLGTAARPAGLSYTGARVSDGVQDEA